MADSVRKRGRQETEDAIQECVLSLVLPNYNAAKSRYRQPRLPGPLPITLSRAQLASLNSRRYYVAEKSDGTRHMMLALPAERSVVLIDRVWNLSFVENMDSRVLETLLSVLPKDGPTLLDGELVVSKYDIAPVFLVYDVACIGGDKGIAGEKFSKRLQWIYQTVENFNSKFAFQGGNNPKLLIQSKLFVPQQEIQRVTSKIQQVENGEYEFHDTGRKRRNKSDGLVFTADDDSYVQQKKGSLMKWKWVEMNTVDFKLKKPLWRNSENPFELELYCGGYNKSDIMIRRQEVDEESKRRIDDEFKSLGVGSAVFECQYEKQNSRWRILQRRSDKNEANFVTVVLSTLETMVDDVSLEEIVKVCSEVSQKKTHV